jgi:hypothetical protein
LCCGTLGNFGASVNLLHKGKVFWNSARSQVICRARRRRTMVRGCVGFGGGPSRPHLEHRSFIRMQSCVTHQHHVHFSNTSSPVSQCSRAIHLPLPSSVSEKEPRSTGVGIEARHCDWVHAPTIRHKIIQEPDNCMERLLKERTCRKPVLRSCCWYSPPDGVVDRSYCGCHSIDAVAADIRRFVCNNEGGCEGGLHSRWFQHAKRQVKNGIDAFGASCATSHGEVVGSLRHSARDMTSPPVNSHRFAMIRAAGSKYGEGLIGRLGPSLLGSVARLVVVHLVKDRAG